MSPLLAKAAKDGREIVDVTPERAGWTHVGFRAIRLRFELETEASEEELATLLKLTERYCVVLQTLASPPQLSASAGAAA